MTGRQIVGVVIAIVFATAVLPPAAAWTVNRRRVARARREVSALALQLQARIDLSRLAIDARVLCGPGEFPSAATSEVQRWLNAPRGSLTAAFPDVRLSPDPWNNCFVADAAAAGDVSRPVWILSAGPNGAIETPSGATHPGGDDIGARVR